MRQDTKLCLGRDKWSRHYSLLGEKTWHNWWAVHYCVHPVYTTDGLYIMVWVRSPLCYASIHCMWLLTLRATDGDRLYMALYTHGVYSSSVHKCTPISSQALLYYNPSHLHVLAFFTIYIHVLAFFLPFNTLPYTGEYLDKQTHREMCNSH